MTKFNYSKLIAKASKNSFRFLEKAYHFSSAFITGFWLGIMDDESLDAADDLYYNTQKQYVNKEYNLSGLFDWEKNMIEKNFRDKKKILLLAAGGGRELIALIKMGYEVDAYECNSYLIEFGNDLLEETNLNSKIDFLHRNTIPSTSIKYDGIIVGWGAYTLIRGKKNRIDFLDQLKTLLSDDGKIMISFLFRKSVSRYSKIISSTANFFRRILFRQTVENGAYLVPNFVHIFTQKEIFNEVALANLKIEDFYNIDYGCTIISKN